MRRARMLIVGAVVLALSGCVPLSPWVSAEQGDDGSYEEPPPVTVGTCPWATPAAPTATPAPDADPVARAEQLALPEEIFWPVIEAVSDGLTDADFSALSSSLAGCAYDDIVAFDVRLTLALYALDGPDNADWFEKHDPSGIGFVSDDVFLYQRCVTVLAGRETWQASIDDHTLEWGDLPADAYGESLLYVGMEAARAQGVSWEDYLDDSYAAAGISYESGSNAELWGSR